MFQVEPILWLQAHSSTPLTWLLSGVTLLGYAPAYAAVILTLAFGFRLRAGLSVLVTLLVCGLLTEGLKNGLALPRPSEVDARVRVIAVVPGAAARVSAVSASTHGGAAAFWGLPAPEAIAAARSRVGDSYGFPSGHVSAALAFVLAAGLFFGSARVVTAGLLWPLVMGLSRMYLGRHFLADVLGGLAVGGVAALATALLLRGRHADAGGGRASAGLLLLTSGAALLVCLLPFVPLLDPQYVGRLAGVAAALATLLKLGFPSDAGTLAQRSCRVAVAAALLLLASRAAVALLRAGGWEEVRLAVALAAAVALLTTLLGAVAIARRLGCYAAASGEPRRSAGLPLD